MAVIGTLDGQDELSTEKRRRLQLFRNTENFANATDAKKAIASKDLLDGEVIIARYKEGDKEQQGVLAIKGIDGYVYFDSAALADALQSVSSGTGISVTDKENNNQVISLDIANAELSNGVITVKDSKDAEIFTISGVNADNVTYTGANSGLTSGSTTVDAAIEKLDDELIKANKANLAGAEVTADGSVVTVSLKDGNDEPKELASFTVESTDANLTVADKADATGITLDVKSIGATATDGTGTNTGNTGTTEDALTQKSYVDNEIAKAKKTAAVTVSGGTAGEGAEIVEMSKLDNEEDSELYGFYITVGEGENATKYEVQLDAEDFVKDSFLSGARTCWGSSTTKPTQPTDVTEAKDATHNAAYIELTMKTITDPDPAEEGTYTLSYIYVKTSDILGDLVGGNGIKDVTDGKIEIDLAEQADGKLVTLSLDGTEGSKKLNVNVTTGEVSKKEGEENWSDSETTGLATSENLAEVANDLQDQIDKLSSQTITGSNAISADTKDGETKVSLVLDSKTKETDTIDDVPVGQIVTNESNALCVTKNGLYLSNVWDCGTF